MLKNPFAFDTSTSHVVHIDDVASAVGPFVCSDCRRVMRVIPSSKPYTRSNSDKTIINRGHFAHDQTDGCENGLETSLHLWGKMIIEEAMNVGLPLHHVAYREVERDFDTHWTYHAVTLEEWQDGIRPDVVLHHADGRLNVEIKVSHAVDHAKAALLRERSQSCIEINLQHFDFNQTPSVELREAILDSAPRSWIVHQLEPERTNLLRHEWEGLLAERGRELLERMANPSLPDRVTRTHGKWHREFNAESDAELGVLPFIGRPSPFQHWFAVRPEHWQNAAIRHYLRLSTPNAGRERRMDVYPHVFNDLGGILNCRLKTDEDPDVIAAAGLTPEQYGTPEAAFHQYFAVLCSEPDREGVHPVARRIVRQGSLPHLMVEDPNWGGYLQRRHDLEVLFDKSCRRLNGGIGRRGPEFEGWLRAGLPGRKTTPRKICADGGPKHIALCARLMAIVNMLDGGWPVDDLLGIESEHFRNWKRRDYQKPYHDGGGCHPYHADRFKICQSSSMMSARKEPSEILSRMARHLHASENEATRFLNTEHSALAEMTPLDFSVDYPTMQFCIDLMPIDPKRMRSSGRRPYERIW